MLNYWPFNYFSPKGSNAPTGGGFTSEILAARQSYISGMSGTSELTATAQSCVSLWENAFAICDVEGTNILNRRSMAIAGRALALRGECVFLIRDDALVPASDWALATRDTKPTAYQLSISESGGGRTETVLAAEVLHFRIGCDASTPYLGSSPLRRAPLTASLLNAIETALAEVFEYAPLGSQIVPFPESRDVDLETLGRGFRCRRGRVLLRESVAVTAAGGPAPATDWKPQGISPDLEKAMTTETLEAARNAICGAFGVLPALFNSSITGPLVRESQRHLCQFTLQPIAELIAEECAEKLGVDVRLDVLRPLQAFDQGNAARAFSTLVKGMAEAKAAGLDDATVAAIFGRLDWKS